MRQLALQSGYSAASIRERIYGANADGSGMPMAGLLLYTGNAGIPAKHLAGLVSQGEPERLGRLVRQALEAMQLFLDRRRAEHHPGGDGTASLHGAACHACQFAPETVANGKKIRTDPCSCRLWAAQSCRCSPDGNAGSFSIARRMR